MATSKARDVSAELAFLTRALKAPTLREAIDRLAERARAESWTHEEFLAACLQREVAAREAHGGEGRIRAARFPGRKSLEDFDFDHAQGSNANRSPTWEPWTSSPPARTWSSSARPAPARPTVRLAVGPTGLPGAGMPVSVLVIATDPKRLIDSPLGDVFAVDLSS